MMMMGMWMLVLIIITLFYNTLHNTHRASLCAETHSAARVCAETHSAARVCVLKHDCPAPHILISAALTWLTC